jgi:hypothetical protein
MNTYTIVVVLPLFFSIVLFLLFCGFDYMNIDRRVHINEMRIEKERKKKVDHLCSLAAAATGVKRVIFDFLFFSPSLSTPDECW